MTATKREIVVGLIFVGSLITLGVFTVLIKGIDPLNPPRTLYVYFHDVGGLREGNVVRVAGLEVGQVDEMKLVERGVLAKLTVHPSVKLHPGYSITVRAFSPLGGKYVDVDRGDLSKPPIAVPERPPTKEELARLQGRIDEAAEGKAPGSGGPGGLLAQGGAPLGGTERGLARREEGDGPVVLTGRPEPELISELADLAEKIKPAVIETVENLRRATRRIDEMQGTVGKLLGDPTIHDNLARATESIDRAAAQAATLIDRVTNGNGTLAKLVKDDRLYEGVTRTVARIESIAAKVDEGRGVAGALFNDDRLRDDLARSVAHVESILAGIDEGKGTLGKVVRDDRLYENLAASLEELKETMEMIARAEGPFGVLLRDKKAGDDLRRAIENVQVATTAIAEGRGTIGRLIMNDRLIQEAERVIVEVRESVEDLREQQPINSFATAVLQGAF